MPMATVLSPPTSTLAGACSADAEECVRSSRERLPALGNRSDMIESDAHGLRATFNCSARGAAPHAASSQVAAIAFSRSR